jgi:hypothetical protein
MKNITTVDWFAQQLARIGVTDELIGHLIEEAKQMEKEQIIKAYNSGDWDCYQKNQRTPYEYYSENYEKND